MKTAVATHEAGHLCAILKMPIRKCIVQARIFQEVGAWRGDCLVEQKCLAAIDKNGVYDFAKSIAGPITQIQLFPETIPVAVTNAILVQGGLLSGYWWLYNNSPKTKTNWHSDMETWLRFRKFTPRGFDLNGFYETERQVSQWIANPATRISIKRIADKLIADECLQRDGLLEIDVGAVPDPKLPASLLQIQTH